MSVVTKRGDDGKTGLLARRTRTSKASKVVNALGDIDELSVSIGISILYVNSAWKRKLTGVQNDLYVIGTVIAGYFAKDGVRDTLNTHTLELENDIEMMEKKLPHLQSFILPLGADSCVYLHQSRVICRRCERSIVRAVRGSKYKEVLSYINRLSDYLFTLARYQNHLKGKKETVVKY